MPVIAARPPRVVRRPVVASRALRLGFAASTPRERGDTRRALTLALLAHLLLILALLLFVPRARQDAPPIFDPRRLAAPDELEIAFLVPLGRADVEVGATAPPPAAEVGGAEAAPFVAPRVVPTGIPAPGAAAAPTESARSGAPAAGVAADRLRIRSSDPRLWGAPPLAAPLPTTPVDEVRARVADAIRTYNDSVAAEDAAARRATDWTVKGENGERWGISPEGIHLGGFTLPAPVFSPPSGRREEFEDRARTDRELADQADRARIGATFKERAKAIRERKDRERRAARGEGSN